MPARRRPQSYEARRIRWLGRLDLAQVSPDGINAPPADEPLAACFGDHRLLATQASPDTAFPEFVDWRRPSASPDPTLPTGHLNPAKLLELRLALTSEEAAGVRLISGQVDGVNPIDTPHLVVGDGTVDGFGVAMPTRTRAVPALPAWLDAPGA